MNFIIFFGLLICFGVAKKIAKVSPKINLPIDPLPCSQTAVKVIWLGCVSLKLAIVFVLQGHTDIFIARYPFTVMMNISSDWKQCNLTSITSASNGIYCHRQTHFIRTIFFLFAAYFMRIFGELDGDVATQTPTNNRKKVDKQLNRAQKPKWTYQ